MASSAAVSHSPFSSHETATALVLGSTGAVGRRDDDVHWSLQDR